MFIFCERTPLLVVKIYIVLPAEKNRFEISFGTSCASEVFSIGCMVTLLFYYCVFNVIMYHHNMAIGTSIFRCDICGLSFYS